MKLIYSNIFGSHVFENGKKIDSIMFEKEDVFRNLKLLEEEEILDSEKKLIKKYPDAFFINKKKIGKEAPIEEVRKVLSYFKKDSNKYFDVLISFTKIKLRNSVGFDWLIIQCVNHIEELNKIINIFAKRLREWYELYNPEFSKIVQDHKDFAKAILKKTKEDILEDIGIKKEESMGADLKRRDVEAILNVAKELLSCYELKEKEEEYLKELMEKNCPNVSSVAGYLIGAKMISIAGSLERLATLPASIVQLLGAEKALFRHIRTKAKAPKHGIIFQHPLVSGSKKEMRGKAARALADKIAIAARVDFFKGEFIGDKLCEELKKRFGG